MIIELLAYAYRLYIQFWDGDIWVLEMHLISL